jgi:uncharacterized membrane protein YqgA involved in biofilm formation
MLIGTLVNVCTVLAGSLIGLLIGKKIPARIGETVMKGMGMITVFIGVTGMTGSENALITILSVVVGAAIGELCDLDGLLNKFSNRLEARFSKGGGKVPVAEGFISATLLFCVGAMTIVGALQDGLSGDHTLLFTKATMDFVSAIIFASTLGIGVMLAAGSVFVIQGSIAVLASLLAPVLNTGNTITEITVVGSVLIFGLGLNILGVTKLKVMNYVPAIFLPILFCQFM